MTLPPGIEAEIRAAGLSPVEPMRATQAAWNELDHALSAEAPMWSDVPEGWPLEPTPATPRYDDRAKHIGDPGTARNAGVIVVIGLLAFTFAGLGIAALDWAFG